jgi:hypothetical protein
MSAIKIRRKTGTVKFLTAVRFSTRFSKNKEKPKLVILTSQKCSHSQMKTMKQKFVHFQRTSTKQAPTQQNSIIATILTKSLNKNPNIPSQYLFSSHKMYRGNTGLTLMLAESFEFFLLQFI